MTQFGERRLFCSKMLANESELYNKYNSMYKPNRKPQNPNFSSGPCAKRPGWTLNALQQALVGRSHRSGPGKARLQEVIDRSRDLLQIPSDYRLGVVPASDTGAIEMALWSLLGARGVDLLAWESFGAGWVTDVQKQLRLDECRTLTSDYGHLPDLSQVDWDRDVVFTWNGTTSGVCVPDGEWIDPHRNGLAICDATSAVFAMDMPWDKLDVITWSWQKVMGGEAGHGMLVLSPRAVERLEEYTPPWPLPKIFRMKKDGKLIESIFHGSTINTPSMLCVEDAIDGLEWARSIGGLRQLLQRSRSNFKAISTWVAQSDWVEFLAVDPATRSNTSICLTFGAAAGEHFGVEEQRKVAKQIVTLLDENGVAYDIGSYRDAPPGLRIWGGATIETADIECLLPWLNWAHEQAMAQL